MMVDRRALFSWLQVELPATTVQTLARTIPTSLAAESLESTDRQARISWLALSLPETTVAGHNISVSIPTSISLQSTASRVMPTSLPVSAPSFDNTRTILTSVAVFQPVFSRSRTVTTEIAAQALALYAPAGSSVPTGTWSPVNAPSLHEAVNEAIPSWNEYITSSNANQTDVVLLALPNIPEAGINDYHRVRYIYRKNEAGGNTIHLEVALLEGSNVLTTNQHNNISETETFVVWEIPSNIIASITDRSNLFLRFTKTVG